VRLASYIWYLWCCLWKLTKNVSVSFNMKWDKMAHITTDRAPIGVTRMASVKALLTVQLSLESRDGSYNSLCYEVQNLSYRWNQRDPNSNPRSKDSPRIIIIIPVHQSQLFRYACPSPALFPYFAVADSSPFFLTTKLPHSSAS
jgi:hypothetical protein